jgi:hypothetical protein
MIINQRINQSEPMLSVNLVGFRVRHVDIYQTLCKIPEREGSVLQTDGFRLLQSQARVSCSPCTSKKKIIFFLFFFFYWSHPFSLGLKEGKIFQNHGLVIALRPQTPKDIRGSWSHYTDTSEPSGNGVQDMVTVQSGFCTGDFSITGPTRSLPALSGPTFRTIDLTS